MPPPHPIPPLCPALPCALQPQSARIPCVTASCCAPAARRSCCRRTPTSRQTPSPAASPPPSRCPPLPASACGDGCACACGCCCRCCGPRIEPPRLHQAGSPALTLCVLCACPPASPAPSEALQVALRWFCSRSLLRHEGVTRELIDRIPGKQTDRKTPLGEGGGAAPPPPPCRHLNCSTDGHGCFECLKCAACLPDCQARLPANICLPPHPHPHPHPLFFLLLACCPPSFCLLQVS